MAEQIVSVSGLPSEKNVHDSAEQVFAFAADGAALRGLVGAHKVGQLVRVVSEGSRSTHSS